ncbi:MAG: O-antigen ligase family protein [Pseudomonadota bacterium]
MMRRSDLVAILLFTVVLSQLVEIGLPFGGLSLEEPLIVLATLACLAAGLSFRFSWIVLAVAVTEFAVAALYKISIGNFNGLIVPILSIGVRFVAFSYLYDWFVRDPQRFVRLLCVFWVRLAVISGLLASLQMVGLPAVGIVDGQFILHDRSVGLQYDPNYASFSFAIAAALIKPLNWQREFVWATHLLLLVATLATASRMGVILLMLVYAYRWSSGWGRVGGVEAVARIWVAAVALAGALFVAGIWSNLNEIGIFHRMSQAATTLGETSLSQLSQTRGQSVDSAFERMALAYTGIRVWQDNFWVGIGPERLHVEIWRRVRIFKATHNGYIDRLAIGGVAGFGFIALTLFCALAPRVMRTMRGWSAELREVADFYMLAVILGSVFLNLSIWLPATLIAAALSVQARERRARQAAARPGPQHDPALAGGAA